MAADAPADPAAAETAPAPAEEVKRMRPSLNDVAVIAARLTALEDQVKAWAARKLREKLQP